MGHIFVSYSHKDTEYAHALADSLQGMGFPVWIDARIDYGSQWPREIQKQLDSCDAFIVIMSPRSFASEWVQSELQRAKRMLKPVFPLLLEGDGPWLSVESTQYYDVRDHNLPDDEFYTDLRQDISAKQTISQSQGSVDTTKSVRYTRPAGMAIFAVIGCSIATVGACFILGVLMLQRITGHESLFPLLKGLPTALGNATLPTASPWTAMPSITTQPTLTSLPVQLPDGSEVVMFSPSGDEYRYTILSARREPSSPGKHLLNLRIRVWTDFIGGVNFWSDSFRLAAEDLRIAPVNDLNLLAGRDETVDGDVEFEIDSSLKEAVLMINVGRIPDAWANKELRLEFP